MMNFHDSGSVYEKLFNWENHDSVKKFEGPKIKRVLFQGLTKRKPPNLMISFVFIFSFYLSTIFGIIFRQSFPQRNFRNKLFY